MAEQATWTVAAAATAAASVAATPGGVLAGTAAGNGFSATQRIRRE